MPMADGGAALALGNLQTICRGCHIRKTRAEAEARLPGAVRRWRELVREVRYPSGVERETTTSDFLRGRGHDHQTKDRASAFPSPLPPK